MATKRPQKAKRCRLDDMNAIIEGKLDSRGYTVRYRNGRRIGLVQDVVDMGYQHQLVVIEELSVELRRPKGAHKAELAQTHSITATHHIPLVPDLVQNIDSERRLLTLQLPQGLVQLGRQDAYCELLAKEIPQYTKKLTNRLRDRVLGEREFPSLQTLRAAGRSDLVQLIRRAGGLATVASYVGLRSPRKPQGYFEDLQMLDWELSCFVASGWVYMPPLQEPLLTSAHLAAVSSPDTVDVMTSSGENANDSDDDDEDDSEGGYFFNTVTEKVSVDMPSIPELVETDDGVMITEDEKQRFMPLQSSLYAAGRHDLATAVKQHGGFRTVAEMLDRKLLYTWTTTETDMSRILTAVRQCQSVAGLDRTSMPSRTQLEEADMSHVVRWIVVAGGFDKVAKKLQMNSARARKCVEPSALAAELEEFSVKFMPREKQHLVPSLRDLRTAGFHDLACQFRRCPDKQQLADIMGKALPSRGPVPGTKRGHKSNAQCQTHVKQVYGETASTGQETNGRAFRASAISSNCPTMTGYIGHIPTKPDRLLVARSSCFNSFSSNSTRCRFNRAAPERQVGCLALAPRLHPALACIALKSRWLQVHPPRRRQGVLVAGHAVRLVHIVI